MKRFSLIGVFILVGILGIQCQCLNVPIDFFSSVVGELSRGTNDLVIVKGKIIGLTPDKYGVRFLPFHKFFGAPLKDTVTIWGGYGGDCRFGVTGLYQPPKDTFIFAMRRINGRLSAAEDPNDYAISNCGHNYVYVTQDSVFGGGFGAFTYSGFPLPEFEDSLERFSYTLGIEESTMASPFSVKCAPNPALDKIMVNVQGPRRTLKQVILKNSAGQIVSCLSDIPETPNGNYVISLIQYPPGIYFLTIMVAANVSSSFRILIQ